MHPILKSAPAQDVADAQSEHYRLNDQLRSRTDRMSAAEKQQVIDHCDKIMSNRDSKA